MYFMYMLYWKWAMYNVYAWYDYVNSITAMGLASFFKLLTVPLKWYRGSIDFKRNRHIVFVIAWLITFGYDTMLYTLWNKWLKLTLFQRSHMKRRYTKKWSLLNISLLFFCENWYACLPTPLYITFSFVF